MQVRIRNTSNSEHYKWAATCDGWHLLERNDVSVIQERVPPGGREALHYHDSARQFFFVLEGEAVMEIEDDVVKLGRHEGIEVPPQAPHQLRNESHADVVFLVVSVPKSHGDRVEMHRP